MRSVPCRGLDKPWSVITFGCWQIAPSGGWGDYCSPEDAEASVKTALEGGITAFDTAEGYGDGESERRLGKALGSQKDEVLITSKIWPDADLTLASYQERLEGTLRALDRDLTAALGRPVRLQNDANCFAISEATMGIAKNYPFVFGVILGTGIGGGIIINGKIHHGRTNIAGEWGHHTLHQNGKKCYCGKKGCVETYISGPALEQHWKEITGKTQSLSEIVKSPMNSDFLKWRQEFLDNFGTALANVIDILDPDVIVLGGGVSNIEFLYSDGIKNVYEKVFSDLVDTPILKNILGDSAGVFGAALLD